MYLIIILFALFANSWSLEVEEIQLSKDYFVYKSIKHVSYLSCGTRLSNKEAVKTLAEENIRTSVHDIAKVKMEHRLQWHLPIGILMDASCRGSEEVLLQVSISSSLDSMHSWLIFSNSSSYYDIENESLDFDDVFSELNLTINSDVVLAVKEAAHYYKLIDFFNFGKIQGNALETQSFGEWFPETGLVVWLTGFKYYYRWDFHNLTLRAISVVLGRLGSFDPATLSEDRFTEGVSAMTKITAQILDVLKEKHNFRFNYTIVDRWVGSPEKNSTVAITNSMYWRLQDISVTCLRVFPKWLDWMDVFLPPTTFLETKFYYLILESGVGDFENRFLTPMSPGVWWCALAAGLGCGMLLGVAAMFERRPAPGYYAVFSVIAAACQQAYEDGVQMLDETISSQGRRLILLVLGLTSMLLYNYYTSSVVSWLLNAAAPTIATMDGLIKSDLELTFEDIGYTRSWLEGPGFYYYSGYKSTKEDELRDKKVKDVKRTVPLLHSAEAGIALVKTGQYAYHTEPYTANQVIGRTFNERELCALGSLQMMPPAMVYVVGQKRSPYRKFFTWSLMRAQERGHMSAARRRVEGKVSSCSGKIPRALALGQAAPAFALLAYAMLLALVMLAGEIAYHRYQIRKQPVLEWRH